MVLSKRAFRTATARTAMPSVRICFKPNLDRLWFTTDPVQWALHRRRNQWGKPSALHHRFCFCEVSVTAVWNSSQRPHCSSNRERRAKMDIDF